uniref:Tripartite motif containing 25 n=1 Tax=Poecilia formosa TaxID=48698 RepID=A0A087XQA0_POEFO
QTASMSAASCLLSEEQFLCSICLDLFKDPLTTPCGHNFCKNCNTLGCKSLCPLCKRDFGARPELEINTFICEMVAQFKIKAQQKASGSSSEQQVAKPGEISCDLCSGTKLKALKSCLVCLLSYCETHLKPHLSESRLKKHQLMEPMKNLEEMLCKKHGKPLELFCKTDQTCICSLCSVLVHESHRFVPLSHQYEAVRVELKKIEAELKKKIQTNRLKVQEIKEVLNICKDAADGEKAEGVQVFTALKESVEKALEELINEIEEKQKTTEKQAEVFVKDLEQEISELMKKSFEVKKLSQSEDHLSLLQIKAALPTKKWTEISIHPPSYDETVVNFMSQMEVTTKKFYNEAELRRVQQYAVDVTLDPATAHPALILSDDEKRVHCCQFTLYHNVFGKQGFSSGRFYFEAGVQGKNNWTLGVARESVDRDGPIQLSPENGYWTVGLRRNKFMAFDDTCNGILCFPPPTKVGVFVNSFYDVNTSKCLHTFHCALLFEKIYRFFSPGPNHDGRNSTPLFISPVPQTF